MVGVNRRHDLRRIDTDHADERKLTECAAALRSETSQARYTNRNLDPFPGLKILLRAGLHE